MNLSATILRLLADLGLERSPKAERGLVVWAVVIAFFALLTLYLWKRAGLFRHRSNEQGTARAPERGVHFMKKAFFAIIQVAIGLSIAYALARLSEPSVKRPPGWNLLSPPHEVTVLARQGDIIWAGGKEGLSAVDAQTRRLIKMPQIQSRDLRGVRAILTETNRVWIGCRQGLFRFDGSQLERISRQTDDDLGPVTALFRSRDGLLWIGVQNGAWQTDVNIAGWKWFGQAEGLLLPTVDVIYQTRDGNVWFGSNAPEAPGLFRFDPQTNKFSNVSSGLSSHAVNDLLEDHSGTLWVATGFGSRGAAAFFSNSKWTEIQNLPGIGGEKIRSLFEDSRNRVWLCSEYNGVAIRESDRWKRVTTKEGLPGTEVKEMLEDSNGVAWLATERGLGCLQTMP